MALPGDNTNHVLRLLEAAGESGVGKSKSNPENSGRASFRVHSSRMNPAYETAFSPIMRGGRTTK
jgi:hypothetical protein